ncbi:NAD(+) diphosphatase [Amorphus sp. 3PC139-8]|uniref:NAD(+) diphosphatase n=1 Tax=Amorphus sp. 3PC139-8 TaxID=2735676 RepID=UPI00345C86A2
MQRQPFPFFPDVEASARTGFAGNRIDRLAEARGKLPSLCVIAARSDAGLYLFQEDKALVTSGDGPLALHDIATAESLGFDPSAAILLGFDDGAPRLAARVTATGEVAGFRAVDLRSLAVEASLPAHDLGALAQARSLLNWHERHGFCSNCGARTAIAQAGYRRDCATCGAQHFPRTDPVVIMLVVDGDRCVLGRQYRFQAGVYSCLAGFVEPGETLEDAVRREISEEAGLRVGAVAYHASQPWPFPSSLMVGCFAEARSFDLVREVDELEDVRWFSRNEVAAMLADRHPEGFKVPPAMAIAHHLIEAYVSGGAPR